MGKAGVLSLIHERRGPERSTPKKGCATDCYVAISHTVAACGKLSVVIAPS